MLFDTIVAFTRLNHALPPEKFSGGSFSFSGNRRYARFWLNDSSTYAPRVTYFRQPSMADDLPVSKEEIDAEVVDGMLRVEFSLQKFPIQEIDAWLGVRFEGLPVFHTWTTTRIDYVADFEVGDDMDTYLDVFKRLRLASAESHTFDRGVMWTMTTRTVKFYDKSRERGFGRGTLRYEVSQRKQALDYATDQWFGCAKTVGELVHAGRALFILAYYWQRLGLGSVPQYSSDSEELLRLHNAFGHRANTAQWVLELLRQYGREAVKREMVSQTTFHRYKNELARAGFIASSDAAQGNVKALHLPTEEVFTPGRDLREALGVRRRINLPEYLEQRYAAYQDA